MISEDAFFLDFWSFRGLIFFFVNILCQEAIVDEKGEHVFFAYPCMVLKDFQDPQGTENR